MCAGSLLLRPSDRRYIRSPALRRPFKTTINSVSPTQSAAVSLCCSFYSERSKYFYFDSFKMNIISTDTEAQSKNFNGVYHSIHQQCVRLFDRACADTFRRRGECDKRNPTQLSFLCDHHARDRDDYAKGHVYERGQYDSRGRGGQDRFRARPEAL